MGRGTHRGFITYEELNKSLGKRNLSDENLSKAFVYILDAKVVNIAIEFIAVIDPGQDKFEALSIAINTLKQNMLAEKFDIGQPIYITKIYDLLNNLDEIVDVVDAKIVLKSTGNYSDFSLNLSEYISADGRILYAPQDVIYEVKYPNLDIKGTIR